MIRVENCCVGCSELGLPCIGHSCPNRRVPIRYCDQCGVEIVDDYYCTTDGADLCEKCFRETYEMR